MSKEAEEKAKEKVKDKLKDKNSRVKYIRLFSLLPHKKGFNINSVHLTDSLVEEIYEQKRFNFNRKKVKLENIFNYRKNKTLSKLLADKHILLMENKKEQKEQLNKIPTKYQITSMWTDGYSASLILQRGKITNKFTKKEEPKDKAKAKEDEDKEESEEEDTKEDYNTKLAKMAEKLKKKICTEVEYAEMVNLTKSKLLKKPLIGIDPGVKDFLNFYAIAEYGDIKNYGNMIHKKETKINPNAKLFKKKVEANDENYLTNAHIKKLRKRARKKEKKKEKNKVKKEQIKIVKPISDQAVPIDTIQEEIKGCYSTKR